MVRSGVLRERRGQDRSSEGVKDGQNWSTKQT